MGVSAHIESLTTSISCTATASNAVRQLCAKVCVAAPNSSAVAANMLWEQRVNVDSVWVWLAILGPNHSPKAWNG